jgi:hypothetical protein
MRSAGVQCLAALGGRRGLWAMPTIALAVGGDWSLALHRRTYVRDKSRVTVQPLPTGPKDRQPQHHPRRRHRAPSCRPWGRPFRMRCDPRGRTAPLRARGAAMARAVLRRAPRCDPRRRDCGGARVRKHGRAAGRRPGHPQATLQVAHAPSKGRSRARTSTERPRVGYRALMATDARTCRNPLWIGLPLGSDERGSVAVEPADFTCNEGVPGSNPGAPIARNPLQARVQACWSKRRGSNEVAILVV